MLGPPCFMTPSETCRHNKSVRARCRHRGQLAEAARVPCPAHSPAHAPGTVSPRGAVSVSPGRGTVLPATSPSLLSRVSSGALHTFAQEKSVAQLAGRPSP